MLRKKFQKTLTLLQKQNLTALFSIDGVGIKTYQRIVQYLNKNRIKWEKFWVSNGVCGELCLNKKIVESIKKFKKEYDVSSYWQRLEAKQVSVVFESEQVYPALLKMAHDHPPLLFVKGNISWCNRLPIAVVGTRQMTAYGRLVTKKITQELVGEGATIISGFMYGVDVLAQQTALDNQGATVGVLGSGFNCVYPRFHRELMWQMLKTGRAVFISEYPPFVQPNRGTFPRRNRLIAALSLATVVTEAGSKSGTQITVGHALEYGREVFAVSGPITSPYHLGVKKMLNQGAALISSGYEVINYLTTTGWKQVIDQRKKVITSGLFTKPCLDLSSLELTQLQQQILQIIEMVPLSYSQLQQQQEAVTAAQLSQVLTELELKGIITNQANKWSLLKQ
jgi:DNA processing protein